MDDRYNHPVFVGTWKYNKRRNVNSDFSILAMHRVFVFFELGVVKNSIEKLYRKTLHDCLWD